MFNTKEILVGADPELFAFNEDYENFVSVHPFIHGTKEKPQPVNMGAIQVDGTAAEFNIQPAKTRDEFLSAINTVRHQLQQALPNALNLMAVPVATFQADYFRNLPEECKELGCDPDFNAWLHGQQNPAPEPINNQRVAGGHVHVGWTNNQNLDDPEHYAKSIHLVRQLDFLLGLSSLSWDKDTIRRQTYGRAGAFRVKPYGVEYRTLSNAWLNNKDTILKVYDLTVAAVKACEDNVWFEDRFGAIAEEIINESQHEEAQVILDTINKEYDIAV